MISKIVLIDEIFTLVKPFIKTKKTKYAYARRYTSEAKGLHYLATENTSENLNFINATNDTMI